VIGRGREEKIKSAKGLGECQEGEAMEGRRTLVSLGLLSELGKVNGVFSGVGHSE
jgi:hypothetical protein